MLYRKNGIVGAKSDGDGGQDERKGDKEGAAIASKEDGSQSGDNRRLVQRCKCKAAAD